jgi:biopolymer transport protein ExbD
MSPADHSVTQLLADWSAGNRAALDQLTPHVYRELHSLARSYLNRGHGRDANDLPAVVKQQYARAPGVYVRADRETSWDPIAQVTAELGAARLQVDLVTQPVDEGKER